jgi:hypothetical protein
MNLKFVLVGFLAGICVGIITSLLFPSILDAALSFVHLSNSSLGYPADYSSIGGSSFGNSISVVWMFFGLLGGMTGFAIFKIKQTVAKKNRF